ncbi:hypothetical protein [Nocardioides insulae]|uniref:hypothetical protein n=1 Tax=Nocardioides insulae TaxID=394734 RepID=UPI000428694D|nr:hypothetical protein [Nocardioides insulae]
MPDPEDRRAPQPEVLEASPGSRSRISGFLSRFLRRLLKWVPGRWRTPLAGVLGLIVGGVGTLAVLAALDRRPDSATPAPLRVDEHSVELILTRTANPRPGQGEEVVPVGLHLDGVVLLSGSVRSTVLWIDAPGGGLEVVTAGLPLTVDTSSRLSPVSLSVAVRDCAAALRWEPADRPFTIAWRDEYDGEHVDRAGDFDQSVGEALERFITASCPAAEDG